MGNDGTLVAARKLIRATGDRLTGPRVRVFATLLEADAVQFHREIGRGLGAPRRDRVTLCRVLACP